MPRIMVCKKCDNAHWEDRPCQGCEEGEKLTVAKCKLIYQCARLLKNELSPYREDWPKSMPKSALRAIEKQASKQREIVFTIREILKAI